MVSSFSQFFIQFPNECDWLCRKLETIWYCMRIITACKRTVKHMRIEGKKKYWCKKRTTINSWALEYINYTRRAFNKPNPPKQKQIIIGNLFLLIWHTWCARRLGMIILSNRKPPTTIPVTYTPERRKKNMMNNRMRNFKTEKSILLIRCASSVDGDHMKSFRKLACEQLFYSGL